MECFVSCKVGLPRRHLEDQGPTFCPFASLVGLYGKEGRSGTASWAKHALEFGGRRGEVDSHPRPTMLLIIDNYDSFTYNLVQYFGEMGATMEIRRNDQVTLEEICAMKPDHICVSPGPCTPKEAGISCDVIRTFGETTPILGVCLGHQCIGHVFGGEVIRAGRLMHGKTSMIHHTGASVFKGLPDPFEATR